MVEKIKSGLQFLVKGVWRDAYEPLDRRQCDRRRQDRRVKGDRRHGERRKVKS